MYRFALACFTGLTLIIADIPRVGAFELGYRLNAQTTTREDIPQLLNPTATTCMNIIVGCAMFSSDHNSIELLNPELSIGTDGSLTIEAIGSWTNARSLDSNKAKIVIRLPKQLWPFTVPAARSTAREATASDKSATCSEPTPPASGNTLSMTQLSEALMGQTAIARSAAFFTSRCDR